MTKPTTFELDGVTIEMIGTGPWKVSPSGAHSQQIKDSTGVISNPTVTGPWGANGRGLKANQNIIWARRDKTAAVVDAANAALTEQTA